VKPLINRQNRTFLRWHAHGFSGLGCITAEPIAMRMMSLITFVCLLLLLAMIPACLQFARICGIHPPAMTSAILAAVIVVGMFNRRS
jgi:hypothetical protein